MENSSYSYARLWLRTSARALLQCHKQLLDTDKSVATDRANEDFLLQIKTYLDQLEISELIEVIHHLTNEIGKQCSTTDNFAEQKFLCYRGITTKYIPDELSSVETNNVIVETKSTDTDTSNHKKKVRYYRGAPIE